MHDRCLSWIVLNVSGPQWRSLPVLKELPVESISRMLEMATEFNSAVSAYATPEVNRGPHVTIGPSCRHRVFIQDCSTCFPLMCKLRGDILRLVALRAGRQ